MQVGPCEAILLLTGGLCQQKAVHYGALPCRRQHAGGVQPSSQSAVYCEAVPEAHRQAVPANNCAVLDMHCLESPSYSMCNLELPGRLRQPSVPTALCTLTR